MSDRVIKKNLILRLTAYILILPLIPAFRSIMREHSTDELVVFITGLVLILALIIYSNNRPYLRISDRNIYIYLLYRHKPEIHSLSSVEKAILHTRRRVVLHTKGFDPLEIRLSKKEMNIFIETMENKGIKINKVDRSS